MSSGQEIKRNDGCYTYAIMQSYIQVIDQSVQYFARKEYWRAYNGGTGDASLRLKGCG